jgi:hypothetical protein
MREIRDPDVVWEVRYLGAYCLNALGRRDDANSWIEQWFDPTEPTQEAERRILVAQQELISGRTTAAATLAASMLEDFPDVDQRAWIDLAIYASFMLRHHGQSGEARKLATAVLRRLPEHTEADAIGQLLSELTESTPGDSPANRAESLTGLAADREIVTTVRVAVLQHAVGTLREANQSERAAGALRGVLGGETTESARLTVALLLAEVLSDDLNDHAAARAAVREVLPTLHRRDLVNRARQYLGD